MTEHVPPTIAQMQEASAETRAVDSIRTGSSARLFLLASATLGVLGSVLVALATPRLVDVGVITWWYSITSPFGGEGNRVALYIGMAALGIAWAGVGFAIRDSQASSTRQMWLIGAAWMAPMIIGPAAFSRDLYSYLAQGTILHVGLDPYHHGPIVLLRYAGHRRLVESVAHFWWRTPAPYGPLFLGIVSLIAAAVGSNLVAGVILVRLLAVLGIVLIAVFVPRLALSQGVDPTRAVWLGAMSPLVVLELVLAGHNDALMAGLVVAGVTLALEGHFRTAIVICALAATVKLPAIVAVVFIALVWIREPATTNGRLKRTAESAALTVTVVGAISAAAGVGLGWVSSAVLTVPGKVHLAITPVTQLGWTVGPVLRVLGAHVSDRAVASGFGVAADVGVAILGTMLLARSTRENLVGYLGLFYVVAALFGPAAWPWYFIWGIALLAATRDAQKSAIVAGLLVVPIFIVGAGGILALPVGSSPIVLAVYIIASSLVLGWYRRTRAASRLMPRTSDVNPLTIDP